MPQELYVKALLGFDFIIEGPKPCAAVSYRRQQSQRQHNADKLPHSRPPISVSLRPPLFPHSSTARRETALTMVTTAHSHTLPVSPVFGPLEFCGFVVAIAVVVVTEFIVKGRVVVSVVVVEGSVVGWVVVVVIVDVTVVVSIVVVGSGVVGSGVVVSGSVVVSGFVVVSGSAVPLP